ncbi:MAG: IS91 family transposase [Rhodothermia bacterium]|nr:MAG: IS91 family transposase [Rhodothermia bacterium]
MAEVLSRYQDDCVALSLQQQRVIGDLVACRTAALGAHVGRCDACGHEEISYNSCRNRHCPKCQAQKQAAWLDAQCENLLDVPYYHIVFTLPEDLGPLALQNKRILYGLLFRSAAETLLSIARDEKHLGARIGFTAVLHTWGQTLMHHPHLHCVVPAGGLSGDRGSPKGRESPVDGQRWIPARENFFLSVRVLSHLFRSKYLAYLREAYRGGELVLAGRLKELADPGAWRAFLEPLQQIDWVVYAKPPFGSPERVLKYLARYTHRVAISNRRLLSIEGGIVAFRYKDYRRGRTERVMRLSAVEFIRRFMLHLLPSGFVRIRHYGLLANRYRKENLTLCRHLLTSRARAVVTEPASCQRHALCPVCKKGLMLFVEQLWPPSRAGPFHMKPLCYT